MKIKPIEILSANLLNGNTQISNNKTLEINFDAPTMADTLIIKNTDITSVIVEYKTTQNGPLTELAALENNQEKNIIFNFAEQAPSGFYFKFTFTSPNATCQAGQIILAKKLITLDNVLSSITPDTYARQGHHYLADGALLKWVEFTKKTIDLRLSNMPPKLWQNLQNILNANVFLTYIFYGDYAADTCSQYALKAPAKSQLERKTALYQVDISLIER
ncbi:MAG: hypothetical protein LBM71_05680 [Elusimicrobiota bacterium]|jgi:hypothetical protein|nr:hypothetical protein [Elusimicrobiota bacterium]